MSQDSHANAVGGLLIAFLAGAAVGAAVTALLTPKTGPQLRDELRDLQEQLAQRGRTELEALRKEVEAATEGLEAS